MIDDDFEKIRCEVVMKTSYSIKLDARGQGGARIKLHGSQCHFHEVGGHSPPYGALKQLGEMYRDNISKFGLGFKIGHCWVSLHAIELTTVGWIE